MLSTLIGHDLGPDPIVWYEARLATECDRVLAYEGIGEAVSSLVTSVPLGVFTAADTSAAELLLTATGLRPSLGPVVGADLVARPKPWPDGLVAVCDRLGVAASDVAYVGDGPSDVEVARSCGAIAVAAAWGHQYRNDRDADITLATPADLLGLVAVKHASGGAR
jgi:phosphoglycolate phosphatase-like HAD superfamily hydrolase